MGGRFDPPDPPDPSCEPFLHLPCEPEDPLQLEEPDSLPDSLPASLPDSDEDPPLELDDVASSLSPDAGAEGVGR